MKPFDNLFIQGLQGALIVVLAVGLFFAVSASYRVYSVWSAGKVGEAALAKAENERKVLIEQAKAEKLAAGERAEAIRIVGEAASRYPAYRYQEFLGDLGESIRQGHVKQIIYLPTETGLPILEARTPPEPQKRRSSKLQIK